MTALIGAPVFASKPYFLDADPVYLENITGYIEDGFDVEEYRDLYDTVIDVETVTGASFRAPAASDQRPGGTRRGAGGL